MTNASFYKSLSVYTGLPFLIAIILGFAYFAASSQAFKNILFETFFAMAFLILPAVSIKIFTTFACHDFDNCTSYLEADHAIDCKADAHKFYCVRYDPRLSRRPSCTSYCCGGKETY